MAKTALDKAIQKEERQKNKRAIEKREEKHDQGTYTSMGSATVGIVAAAAHDKLRGKPNDQTGEMEVAKYGPLPANITNGVVLVVAGAFVPKRYPIARGLIGGLGLGQALGGVYRLTYDHWPEKEEQQG